MFEGMLQGVQRRMATAMIVGMLTFGEPVGHSLPPVSPQAVVRMQPVAAGAQVWRELFPARPAPN